MSIPLLLPWRSVNLPRALVLVAMIASLPLYLRTPPWCDITLYDLAARNLLTGGVHYRDLFDTNLPGFVWILTALRWAFGPSPLVVRLADFSIVLAVVLLIDLLARWGGATRASRWWALAAMALLYPLAVEMVHAQRDTWMALPALAAVALRLRRARATGENGLTPPGVTDSTGRVLLKSAGEGMLWGLAVWLKPHVLLMAAGVWLLSARRLASGRERPFRSLLADLLGNVMGGLAVGISGLAWLVGSGAWPYFWTVATVWNPEYTKLARLELHFRVDQELYWFPPWSLWLVPTVPLAFLSIIDATPWAGRSLSQWLRPGPVGRLLPRWIWDRQAGVDERFVRGVLGGLYLIWAAQAFLIQRGFMYAHMTETLLMLGLWASHRWAMAAIPLLWILVTSSLWLYADANQQFQEQLLTIATDKHVSADPGEERYIVRHPLADGRRMSCWSTCWRLDLTPHEQYVLADQLRRIRDHEAAISWEELAEVAEYLRSQNVGDREVLAWNDSPHAVYLLLGIKPGIRFMHTSTAQSIGLMGYQQVQSELAATAGTARFAVGDLEWTVLEATPAGRAQMLGPPRNSTDLLPGAILPRYRATFPFNQPAVFRSKGGLGRYTVHQLFPPLGDRELSPQGETIP